MSLAPRCCALRTKGTRWMPVAEGLQLFLGVAAHVGVGLGGENGLGLGDVGFHLLVFDVGFDALGQGAVFLGGLGVARPVRDDRRDG